MPAVDALRSRVQQALERRGMPLPGQRLLVACSGGPDSTVLLDVLVALGAHPLSVASVDHGLRPTARDEAERACAFARSLGVEARVLPVVTRATMAAARQARYQALVDEAKRIGASALVVAHTASDQAETLLDRLLRGAGTRGLSAMPRTRPLGEGLVLCRPLLDVTSSEVEAYVAARGLDVARDPTNRDPAYRRSRLRHDVLPLLRRERADLDRSLVALADRLRADADALDDEAARAHHRLTTDEGLDVHALADLPDALCARVVAQAAGVPLESVHLDAIRRLCEDARGTRTLDLPGGVVAERRYDRLRFGAPARDPGDVEMVVTAPGRYTFFDMQVDVPEETLAAFGPELVLRNVRPGDHLRSRKVKRILIDRKVPRPERRKVPLLVRRSGGNDEVVWIGPSRALTEGTRVQ